MKNEKLQCPNEVNLNLVRSEILAVDPSAEVYVLAGNIVQVIHGSSENDFSELVNNHDGSAQNAAEASLAAWEAIKAERAQATEEITVIVDGMELDGDEEAQTRMARAITGLEPEETQRWKLTDNTWVELTREKLKEALRLAGQAQTQLWEDFMP